MSFFVRESLWDVRVTDTRVEHWIDVVVFLDELCPSKKKRRYDNIVSVDVRRFRRQDCRRIRDQRVSRKFDRSVIMRSRTYEEVSSRFFAQPYFDQGHAERIGSSVPRCGSQHHLWKEHPGVRYASRRRFYVSHSRYEREGTSTRALRRNKLPQLSHKIQELR